MNITDTIYAVSSPPGRGQRAILRLSGPDACALLDLEEAERGSGQTRVSIGEEELPALILISRAPNSFSGEDMVELLVPGSQALVNRVQVELIARSKSLSGRFRSAEPGEFTARAYLNGRIDLLQAEGIADSIRARTDSQLRAATIMREGSLSALAADITTRLTGFAGLVEAGIDFTEEEDVVAISNDALAKGVNQVIHELRQRLGRTISVERLESVPLVVLAGAPNSGKSTLFNALLGRERTVVADIEGTTRDVILEPLQLGGELEVMLADVAGVGFPVDESDSIEIAMKRHAHDALDRADLVVRCTPIGASRMELVGCQSIIDIVTKSDLAEKPPSSGSLGVSAWSGEGLPELQSAIAVALGGMSNSLGAGVIALSHRHEALLLQTLGALERTIEVLGGHAPPAELLAATLRDALDALGELVGRVTPDDVLDEVFARFCVGK